MEKQSLINQPWYIISQPWADGTTIRTSPDANCGLFVMDVAECLDFYQWNPDNDEIVESAQDLALHLVSIHNNWLTTNFQ